MIQNEALRKAVTDLQMMERMKGVDHPETNATRALVTALEKVAFSGSPLKKAWSEEARAAASEARSRDGVRTSADRMKQGAGSEIAAGTGDEEHQRAARDFESSGGKVQHTYKWDGGHGRGDKPYSMYTSIGQHPEHGMVSFTTGEATTPEPGFVHTVQDAMTGKKGNTSDTFVGYGKSMGESLGKLGESRAKGVAAHGGKWSALSRRDGA